MAGRALAIVVMTAFVSTSAGCARRRDATPAVPVAVTSETPLAVVATLATFAGDVRPVLLKSCTPCHEPGGKMYDRLPFDKEQTIRDHPEGILRRLKGEDKAAVERWLASEAPGAPEAKGAK